MRSPVFLAHLPQARVQDSAVPLIRALRMEAGAPNDVIDFYIKLCEYSGWRCNIMTFKVGYLDPDQETTATIYQRDETEHVPMLTVYSHNFYMYQSTQAFLASGIVSDVGGVLVEGKYRRVLAADHLVGSLDCFAIAVRREGVNTETPFIPEDVVRYQGQVFRLRGVVFLVGSHYVSQVRNDNGQIIFYDDLGVVKVIPVFAGHHRSRLLFYDNAFV